MKRIVLMMVIFLLSLNGFAGENFIEKFLQDNNKFLFGYIKGDGKYDVSSKAFEEEIAKQGDSIFFNKYMISLWKDRIDLLEKTTGYNPVKAIKGMGFFIGLDKNQKPEGIIALHHEGDISKVMAELLKEEKFKNIKPEIKGKLQIFQKKGKPGAITIVDNKDIFLSFGENYQKYQDSVVYLKYFAFLKEMRAKKNMQLSLIVPATIKVMLENPAMLPPKLAPAAGILKGLKGLEFFAADKTFEFSLQFTEKSFVEICKGGIQAGKAMGKSLIQMKLSQIDAFNEKASLVQKLNPQKIMEEANLRWGADFLEKFDFQYGEDKIFYRIENLKISAQEVAVIAGISGVLAAIAIPNFQKARQKAKEKAVQANCRVIMGAIEMYELDNEETLETGSLKEVLPILVEGGYLTEGILETTKGKMYYWDAETRNVNLK